jgi:hypothetical protein
MKEIYNYSIEPDSQFTSNVTLRRVRASFVAVEKQQRRHCECVSIALGVLHAMRMSHIVICGLSGSAIFFHII